MEASLSPWVSLNILNTLQLPFTKMVSQCQIKTYLDQLGTSQQLAFTTVKDATNLLFLLVRNICEAINLHGAHSFQQKPPGVAILLGLEALSPLSKTKAVTKAYEPPPSKEPKTSLTQDNEMDNVSKALLDCSLGIIESTGAKQNRARMCPVYWKVKTGRGKGEHLCIDFMVKVFACKYGSRCNQHHVTNVGSLPDPKQKALVDWVGKTSRMTFALGKGPAGN